MVQPLQDLRVQADTVFLKHQGDGGASQLKVALFRTPADPLVLPGVDDTAHHQRAYLRLHHGAEILRGQQCPAAAVENEDGVLLTGNGLHTVQHARNEVVVPLIAVVNVAVMMVIRGAQAQHQTVSPGKTLRQLTILQQIPETVVRVLDGEAAVFPDAVGTEPTVTRADEVGGFGVKGHRLPGAGKEIPVGLEAPELGFRQLHAVAPGIGSHNEPGQAGAEKRHRQAVGMGGHNAL